ncbi:MAG: DUF4384 domain-containing protein [Rikenellaceae bacterium]
MRYIFILILLTISTSTAWAQNTRRVEVEYTYHVPGNVSHDAAREIALQRAQLKAIADEYGTTISQNNFTNIVNSNNSTSVDMQTIGSSEVKGEWIETIGEPEYAAYFDQGMMVIRVKVVGRVRAISYAQVEFTANILCNGTTPKFSSTKFKSGDDLYLHFQSPQNGYLAVYLVDSNKDVYCLLPYRNAPEEVFEIKKGVEYILFSAQQSPTISYIDEYVMTNSGRSETNQIYTIFSPNRFVKSDDSFSEELLPRKLSFEKFQGWLAKNRKRDVEMQAKIEIITIE